jgi:prolycopene isomerase
VVFEALVDQQQWDAVVIGSGVGGLVTASQLAAKGAKTLVLERYLIPGGSGGAFHRNGYTFDVGASMIFGFGEKGYTNLLTRALADIGEHCDTIPDQAQLEYHMPGGLRIAVDRDYDTFIADLSARFPHEAEGIRRFYDACWQVFNCLDAMPLLSLEDPAYLTKVFFKAPFACLGLARWLPFNVGAVARQHIKDPQLLKFIDIECFCWSVMPADRTPMINAGMVFSDRHAGGINYPKGGVGVISQKLVKGLERHGGSIRYKARVTQVLIEKGQAVGVKLADGEIIYAKRVISNATRWDTFSGEVAGTKGGRSGPRRFRPNTGQGAGLAPTLRTVALVFIATSGRTGRCDSGWHPLPSLVAGGLGADGRRAGRDFCVDAIAARSRFSPVGASHRPYVYAVIDGGMERAESVGLQSQKRG